MGASIYGGGQHYGHSSWKPEKTIGIVTMMMLPFYNIVTEAGIEGGNSPILETVSMS